MMHFFLTSMTWVISNQKLGEKMGKKLYAIKATFSEGQNICLEDILDELENGSC